MVQDEVRYETKTAKAVRGLESRTVAKWAQEGWELQGETPGRLRTELVFRRPRSALPKGLLLGIGGLAAVMVAGGVTAAVLWSGGPSAETAVSSPAGSSPTVEPSEVATEPSLPPEDVSEAPEPALETPAESVAPAADPYTYGGPDYNVVVVDQNQGPARLTSYWVVTDKVDFSTGAYRDRVKLLVADVARSEGAAEVMVQVVTDKEIALAESPSTYQAFAADRGMDYAVNTIPQKEVAGWVASYTGGLDYDTGKSSTSPDAYEVIWRPYAASEVENWKPELKG